jgi:hypothetical protein
MGSGTVLEFLESRMPGARRLIRAMGGHDHRRIRDDKQPGASGNGWSHGLRNEIRRGCESASQGRSMLSHACWLRREFLQ